MVPKTSEITREGVTEPLDEVRFFLALSDERDQWYRRLADAERDAYELGVDDGRATACVNLAEMEQHREKRAYWNEWWAKVARIITSCDHPDQRRRQLESEIAADQLLMTRAKERQRDEPGSLSPLEYAILHRIRGERLDESEAA